MKEIYIFSGVFLFTILCYFLAGRCVLISNRDRKTKSEITDSEYKVLLEKGMKRLDGREFEEFISYILIKLGHKATLTPTTRDGGIDIVLDNDTAIECKQYKDDNLIGSPVINKIVGACVINNMKKAIVVTTSSFTKDAIETYNKAKKNIDIELWYIDDIIRMCMNLNKTNTLKFLGYEIENFKEGIKIAPN